MRRILVAAGVALVLGTTAAPASATTSVKRVTGSEITDSQNFTEFSYFKGGEFYLEWYRYDGTTYRHLDDGDAPISSYNGAFRSSQLWWATLSFEDPSVCLFSNPPDSGADPYDGCTDVDLIVSLRWDSYGSRTKTILSDGTIVYSRAATVSGSVTFNGSPLFDPAILTTAAISRYVYA